MNVLFTLMKSDIHLFWRRREKKSYLGRQREKMPRHRELMKTGRVRTPHTYVSNTWHFAQKRTAALKHHDHGKKVLPLIIRQPPFSHLGNERFQVLIDIHCKNEGRAGSIPAFLLNT